MDMKKVAKWLVEVTLLGAVLAVGLIGYLMLLEHFGI